MNIAGVLLLVKNESSRRQQRYKAKLTFGKSGNQLLPKRNELKFAMSTDQPIKKSP